MSENPGLSQLPRSKICEHVTTQLIDYKVIKTLGKKANVSERMVACALAHQASELPLKTGAVVAFRGRQKSWYFSRTISTSASDDDLLTLFDATGSEAVVRLSTTNGVLTAFRLGGPEFPAMFMQLLPEGIGNAQTLGEEIAELRKSLFRGIESLEPKLSGYVGAFKPKVGELDAEEAVDAFLEHYNDKLKAASVMLHARMTGSLGRRFLSIRLKGG